MALGEKLQLSDGKNSFLGPKILLDEEIDNSPRFIDQLANAGLGAFDAAASLAGQAISFPASLAYEAAGHLSGQGRDIAREWGQIPSYYTQPGMITKGIRSLAGLPEIPQDQTMAMKYSEPIAKTFETLIPSQQIEENLARVKELGAPEKITDALAFGASKFIELMAFGGYHKLVKGGIGKVGEKLKEYKKAPTPEIQRDLLDEMNGLLEKLKEKGVDTTELKVAIPTGPVDTPIMKELEVRNAQTAQRTNAESQQFMQSRTALQQALNANLPKPEPVVAEIPKQTGLTPQETLAAARRNVELTGDPQIISMDEYRNLLKQEELAKIPTQENVSAKLEGMRAEAKARVEAEKNRPTPEQVLEEQRQERIRQSNERAKQGTLQQRVLQQDISRNLQPDEVPPPQPELPPLPPTENVSAKLEAMRQAAKDAIEKEKNRPTTAQVLEEQRQQRLQQANEIARQGTAQQRSLQSALENSVPVSEPIIEPPVDLSAPRAPDVSGKLEAMRAEAKAKAAAIRAEMDRINNAPPAGSDIPLRLEQEKNRTNEVAREAVSRQRQLQQMLNRGLTKDESKPVVETKPLEKEISNGLQRETKTETKVIDEPVVEQPTFYHGSRVENLTSGKDLPNGHRGYFLTSDPEISKSFGDVHKAEVKAGLKIFDGTNKEHEDLLFNEYKKFRPIRDEEAVRKKIRNGSFNFYEDPQVLLILEKDLKFDGNTQNERGTGTKHDTTRIFNKNNITKLEKVIQDKSEPSSVQNLNTVPKTEPVEVPEFEDYKTAKTEYTINKRRYKSFEAAKKFYDSLPQETIDEYNPEIVKIKNRYGIGTKVKAINEEEIVAKVKETVKELTDIDQGRDVPIPKIQEQMTGEQVYDAVQKMIPEIQAALQGQNTEIVHKKLAELGDQAAVALEFELLDKIEAMLPQLWKKKMELDGALDSQFKAAHAEDMKSAKTSSKIKEIKVDANGYDGVSVGDIKNAATAINKIVGNIGAVGSEIGSGKQSRLSLLNQAEIDSLRNIREAARKVGKDVSEFLMGLGMTKENAQKIVNTLGEMKEEKVGRKEMRSTPEQVAKTATGLEGEIEKVRSPVMRYYKDLAEKRQIVDTFKPGDRHYERQLTGIPESRPELSGKPMGHTALSPHNVLNVFQKGDNPVTDVMKAHGTFTRNLSNGKKWAKDLLADIPEMSKESLKKFETLYDKYSDRYKLRAQIGRSIASLEKRIGKKTGEHKTRLEKELKIENAKFKEVNKMAEEMVADFDALISGPDSPALTEPTVRIMLQADGTLPSHISLSPKEMEIATRIREYFDSTAEDMKSLGMPTKEGYVHRVWKPLISEDVMESGFFQRSMRTPSMLRQMSQMPEGRTWYPDAKATLDSYIPIIERELAYNPFLDRWSSFIEKTDSPKLRSYMQQWVNENLYRKPETFMSNVNSAATGFEFARLIGLSLPVAFKHLMKVWGTTSQNSLDVNALALIDTMKALGQYSKEKFGFESKGKELEVFRSYVTTRDIVKSLDESPLSGMLDMVKGILGSPTATIEAFDNGISVFSAIRKGAKKGLDTETTERAMIRTILDVNFRSGWDQPLWLKSDAARWMLMFQSTPYKSAELKYQMIKRAFNNERDAFGQHYGQQFLKYILTIGTIEAIARANDTSVIEQVMHMPFFSHWLVPTKKEPGVKFHPPKAATSPLVGLAYNMTNNRKGALEGVKEQFGLDRDFLPTKKSSPSLNRYVNAYEGKKKKFNTITQMILGLKPLE